MGELKCTKMQWKMLKKIEDELQKEMYNQIGIVSGSMGLALYYNWGFRQQRISKLFKNICVAWDECVADDDTNILDMCKKETGFTIGIPEYEGDYKDLIFFQEKKKMDKLSIHQRIYMRQRQRKWLGAEVLASALISVHRQFKFGGERIGKLYDQMVEIMQEFNYDCKKIEDECYKVTNVGITVK